MAVFTVPVHEHNDCHNPAGTPAGGQFCAGHQGVAEFLSKYGRYEPEMRAFAAKHGEGRLKADVDAFWSNQRRGPGVPSYAFQTEVMQAGDKRLRAEKRATKGAAATAMKSEALRQIADRGWKVGDEFFDSETGTRATLRIGRDGRPYMQSAMGKHPTGARWRKKER